MAKPSMASRASREALLLLSAAEVATTPMVVFTGWKLGGGVPAARAAAVSMRRRPSGASRVPAIKRPLVGSRTSPTALTATMAPSFTSSRSAAAQPSPPRMARVVPWSLPTVAPVPAPTFPWATGPWRAAAAAA